MSNKIINSRTRIRVYHSTASAAVGYADNEAQREAAMSEMYSKPDFVGTPRTVSEYVSDLKSNLGGVFVNIKYRLAATGEDIAWGEIEEALWEMEFDRLNK
jgi:hypothetical protein